jgi:excisionase family DNA binding protein
MNHVIGGNRDNEGSGLLRKREAAALLACSTRTIDREASCGRLNRVKVRGGVRFRESEIRAIIEGKNDK